MKQLLSITVLLFSFFSFSQVGIGVPSPNAAAVLDLTSSTKGFLPPRMTFAQKNAMVSPATGLQIWCLDCNTSGEMQFYNGSKWTNALRNAANFAKPDAPTSVVATPGYLQARVAFATPASNGGSAITAYTVTASPGNFTATGTASPITVTGLSSGSSYTFTVVATSRVGSSVASAATATVTIQTVDSVPNAPENVIATPGNTQASIAFSLPAVNTGSSITSYTVTASGGIITATGTTSPIRITGLTSGTSYTFTVTATNAAGSSAASVASTPVTAIPPSGLAICDGTRITDVVEITSSTGKVWMDRNLGASKKATSATDFWASGCLYQWGRGNDGHASINRTSANAGAAVNGNTATIATTDTPGNALFIVTSDVDWRDDYNNVRWQSSDQTNNNPCPAGFRVPTKNELELEVSAYTMTKMSSAYTSIFRFPSTGVRDGLTGNYGPTTATTNYWSSDPYSFNAWFLQFTGSRMEFTFNLVRGFGASVRCIKN